MLTKRPFLVVHDYGAGGLWTMVLARSEDEITRRFRDLKVVPHPPAWLDDEQQQRMSAQAQDVESELVTGWLADLVR